MTFRLQREGIRQFANFEQSFPYGDAYACLICKIGLLKLYRKPSFKCNVCERWFEKELNEVTDGNLCSLFRRFFM